MYKNLLLKAIEDLDQIKIRKLLDNVEPDSNTEELSCLVHQVVENYDIESQIRSKVISMLCNAGFSVNEKDNDGLTPLHYAAQDENPRLCQSLLQCGADMQDVSNEKETIMEFVFSNYGKGSEIYSVFHTYKPGLWNAVKNSDVNATRKLINLWCRTDLMKDGKTLKDLALEGGMEDIISLVLNVEPTMKFVHHLLAGDIKNAYSLLDSAPQNINLNFRNLNERGAPILYYAIERQLTSIIRLMRKYDCRLYSVMRDEDGNDMPVFFACLNKSTPTEVVQSLLEGKDVAKILNRITYKGKSVLEVAINSDVNVDIFDALIQAGGADVIISRDQFDRTPRQYALHVGKKNYAKIVDKNVRLWLCNPSEYPGQRENLALGGYTAYLYDEIENHDEFLQALPIYQQQISNLCLAIENGDVDEFKNLMKYEGSYPNLFVVDLFWKGRAKEQGLPILHRTVIWEQEEMIRMIFDCPHKCSIDDLLDQYHRTALYYALGLNNSKIVSLLMGHGCSEHTLDKNGIEPLDFKLRRNTPQMDQLISRLKAENFKTTEPHPWNLPIDPTNVKHYSNRYYHSHNHSHSHSMNNFHVWRDVKETHESSNSSTCTLL